MAQKPPFAGFSKRDPAKEVPSAPFACKITEEETDLDASNYPLNHFKTIK